MLIEELSLVAMVIVTLVVGLAIVSGRIGIATPLLLVLVGVGIGFIPGVPLIEVDPEIILMGILPPILYAAAVNVPVVDLRRNFGPVAALSVVLVIISALVIGALVHFVVPEVPFAAAVALGAVVAPTDAVAATSIGKRVGMPPRLVTILEGESLVNDATSLVLLRTAIAATAGGFLFWEAVGSFAFSVAAAILIGYLIGIVTVWVRSKLNNPVYDTAISFIVPFLAFVPTEYVGASGVLAVVVAGLYSGHRAPKKLTATARMNERLNWRTIQFLLENGVFLLMGLELHKLLNDVDNSSIQFEHTLVIGLGVGVVLIVLRLLFMWPLTWSLRRSLPRYEARAANLEKRARLASDTSGAEPATKTDQVRIERLEKAAKRTAADVEHAHDEGLDWRGATILGWSGMRGVVTLAAAQSIPTEVPFRSQIVLIAFIAAAFTLLLHGLTLSPLIKKLKPKGPDTHDRREEFKSLYLDLVEVGNSAVDAAAAREKQLSSSNPNHLAPSEEDVERARSSMAASLSRIALSMPKVESQETSEGEARAYTVMRLTNAALEDLRAFLLDERAIGAYSSHTLSTAEEALDQYELRLTPPTTH